MSFYKFAKSVVYGFLKITFRIRIEGEENIPKDVPFIVCANHISNLDPPLLGSCLPFPLVYMAKEELFHNKLFAKLITSLGAFPIQRGKGDIAALRSSVKMLQSGKKMVIFPEGGRSDGEHLRKGKPGAALIAVKARVNILPVGIRGKYKPFRKITIRIGQMIHLDEYFDKKVDSEDLRKITDERIMTAIADLAEVKTYENRNC